jgi:hypothetical protein
VVRLASFALDHARALGAGLLEGKDGGVNDLDGATYHFAMRVILLGKRG